MLGIIIAIVTLSGLGFVFGLGLAFIAKVFHVETDPRIEQLEKDILPGINCGACGYPGCSGYADAIVTKNKEINLCSPGGSEVVDAISNLLGVDAESKLQYVAKVHCLGDDAVALKDYEFNGDEDCSTVATYFNGERACKFGCVGRGNCIRMCPVDAIKRDKLNRVWIDANICIGCEKCVAVCPTNVIQMVPKNGEYFVACSSPEPGKIVRKICKKGCIACKICEKASGGVERIEVTNFLARVNYKSDIDLEQAAVKCPADVIVPIINQNRYMLDNKKNKAEKGS
jgi:electron transport complex protein RnfB